MNIPLPGGKSLQLSRQKPPKTTGIEQGSAGTSAAGYFDGEMSLSRIRNPSISQIMQMIDNDGTAQMLYSVLTFPVQAIDWHLDPDPEDVVKTVLPDGTTKETHPQADFVEACLRNPEHKGGMSTPFSLILADIAMAVAQGYRFFEIVYKINDQGQIVFKKIAAREAKEITILSDETGGFAGVKQIVKRGEKTVEVTIDLPYCFLYTYRKERNKLKGASALRPAFYHYDKKHRLYYLQNQQAQVNAMGFKVLDSPDGAVEKDRSANLAAVDKMAVRPSVALPFGWKLNIAQPARGLDLQPAIDGQDTQMARSVLAQGMLLGNQSSNAGGSYALANSHQDVLTMSTIAFMSTIEEHITSFLISKLIDYNFDKPLYPTFKFNDLGDETTELLSEAFKSLIAKGAVPNWVARGISDKVAAATEIERPEEDGIAPDDDDYIGLTNSPSQPGLQSGDTTQQQSKKKVASSFSTAKSEWWRELTAAEAKVQFAKIEKQADKSEASLFEDIKPVIEKISADATTRLKPLLEAKGAKALDGFELKYGNDLQKVFNTHMLNMYSDAKTGAADEIKKPAPGNKQSSKDLIAVHAQGVVDKQLSDLMFGITTTVTDAVRKNLLDKTELSVGQILASIAALFNDFYEEKEELTSSSLISFALNIGRDDVFQKYDKDIYGYQYSAILDDVVCPVCEDLDGSVVEPAVYYSTIWVPPIHFNCRCIWVAIMNEEEEKPPFKDIPEAPGGTTSPSLSTGHDENSLSAAAEYQLYLNKQTEASWLKRRT